MLIVNCRQGGFIAIMSVVIISVLLLAITLGMGFSSFFTRFNVLDAESKERSLALAEACGDAAILKLASNKDYVLVSSDHAISVGGDTCNIVSLSPAPSRTFPISIQTQGIVNKAYTNLKIIINSSFKITSLQECATGPCP
jgi:hypothetical protein